MVSSSSRPAGRPRNSDHNRSSDRPSHKDPSTASNFGVTTGEFATDSDELPIPENMFVSMEPQHISSATQDSTDPSTSATVAVSQSAGQFITDSIDINIDIMEAAMPFSSGPTLEGLGNMDFSWDDPDSIDEFLQIPPIVSYFPS